MKKYVVIIAAIFIVFVVYKGWRAVWTETMDHVTFVKNGERCTGTLDCAFLEYSADETFENSDEWAYFKFNSSDVHREITAGTVCEKVVVAGWRIPFLSWFRNIISVTDCAIPTK